MRKIALYLCFLGLTGCTLTEQVEVEVNAKPTLVVDYGDMGQLTKVSAFLFDPQGVLYDQIEYQRSDLDTATLGMTIAAGIPPGLYTLVCYGNYDNMNFSLPSKALVSELSINQLEQAMACNDCDSVVHSVGQYEVLRGKIVPRAMPLHPLYYDVELTIAEVDQVQDVPLEDYRVEFVGLPTGFDAQGTPQGNNVVITPTVVQTPERELASKLKMFRFDDHYGVRILIYDRTKLVVDTQLRPTKYGIDPQSHSLQRMVMRVNIGAMDISVSVNDWTLGTFDNPQVGG